MAKQAQEIMTKDVITVNPSDTVEKAARLLLEHHISGLPVVDGERRVVGVISEGDLVLRGKEVKAPAFSEILGAVFFLGSQQRFFNDLKKTIAQTVEQLMSSRLVTVREDATLEQIATLMADKGINRIPVVDEKMRLLGIVTRQDIIRHL